jgi:hypothetical protein
MASTITPILGNADPVIVMSASGSGASTTVFIHNTGGEGGRPAQLFPATFIFAITDIVGVFSAIQINLEWSPISSSNGTPQYETVGTWNALSSGTVFFPCSATGQYRLNCTSFTGGTSFNIYASIASSMPQGSGGGGSVTQGTVPWVDNLTQVAGITLGATAVVNYGSTPAAVAVPAVNAFVTNAGSIGGGVQFADNAASGASPTGTLSMGWDSANSKVRALKVDASQNLLVDVSNASIAVTGTFFQATQPVSIAATVNVQGTKTPADSYVNPTDAVDTFALLAGWDATNTKWQRVQVDAGTGTLKVDPGTVTVTGTVSVTNFANPLPVSQSGLWNVNQAIGVAGFEKITDGTNTAAVKAASTAAAAADSSLVVALSPNSPLPAGTNVIGHVVVDSGAITVSGTVTANQGTSPWTIQGDSASGASKAGNPVQIGGVFNTLVPIVSSGQTVEAQFTKFGSQIVATGADNFVISGLVDGSSLNPTSLLTDSYGALSVARGLSNVLIDGQINPPMIGFVDAKRSTQFGDSYATGLNVFPSIFNGSSWDLLRSGGAIGTVATAGATASGSSKAGNPVQIGGVFNSSQPFVTTGQVVEAQSTSAGALIVATGIDPFIVQGIDRDQSIKVLLECIRRAIVAMACEGGKNRELDFDPTSIEREQNLV